MSAIEILIAEDNEDDIVLIREALSEVWDTDGLHVVRDGVEALAYLRRKGRYRRARRPGLVVLDLNMPGKDGFQVLKEMKEDPSLRHIPVIVLTTSDRETDIVRSYSQGACSFITKPSRFDEFREIVEQFALYWYLVARIPTSGR
ncbi:MAG: response regulator [Planctomycetes bacterium]|nr:response regulator [Planctomycetota bacterium]